MGNTNKKRMEIKVSGMHEKDRRCEDLSCAVEPGKEEHNLATDKGIYKYSAFCKLNFPYIIISHYLFKERFILHNMAKEYSFEVQNQKIN